MVIPIDQVVVPEGRNAPPKLFIRHMAAVLKVQGQIEPLQVTRMADGRFTTFLVDPHGVEIVHAARELGWPTILVVEMKRFER